MKSTHPSIYFLITLLILPVTVLLAHGATITIDVLTTFDYPGVGNSTLPQKINDAGEIAGYYTDSSGVTRGFVRFRNGNFSAPIVEPNDTGNDTEARGINNSRVVCGSFVNLSDSARHGFFLSQGTFTQFDVADATGTAVYGLSDAGDFAGAFATATQDSHAFANIGGSTLVIDIPDAILSAAYAINNLDQITGQYTDSTLVGHGFFRNADGALTFPIDPPDSVDTTLFGINDRKWMVGRYVDGAGVTHALFAPSPARFIAFDYPGATFTSFNGINRQGLICGRYQDSSGVGHGILARVRRMPAD